MSLIPTSAGSRHGLASDVLLARCLDWRVCTVCGVLRLGLWRVAKSSGPPRGVVRFASLLPRGKCVEALSPRTPGVVCCRFRGRSGEHAVCLRRSVSLRLFNGWRATLRSSRDPRGVRGQCLVPTSVVFLVASVRRVPGSALFNDRSSDGFVEAIPVYLSKRWSVAR